ASSAARRDCSLTWCPPYDRPFGDAGTDADEEGRDRGRRRFRRVRPDRVRPRAAEGTGAGRGRVDGAYTTYPLAGASRTSLMTGWRPEKTGVWGEPDGRVDGATPLQEHFHAGGYFTARVGPVFHGPGEREYRWDAVNAPRAGVPVATRAAAALTQAREPF